jgi:hypothetical protein
VGEKGDAGPLQDNGEINTRERKNMCEQGGEDPRRITGKGGE